MTISEMRTGFSNRTAIILPVLAICFSCSKPDEPFINLAPRVPSNPIPADGAELTTVDFDFYWACSDPNGDPVTYDICLDTMPDPGIYASQLDTAFYSSAEIHYNSTYYWKVVARDSSGARTEGPIWTFSIGDDMTPPLVTLTAPNGGELWYIGTERNITWVGQDEDSVASYELEYSINGGLTWVSIQGWTAGNPGTFAWTVPDTASPYELVRVSCRDVAGNIGTDISDTSFYAWPEGGIIAFASDRDGYYNIYTMYADGTHQRNISNNSYYDYYPSWSPDCSKITFQSLRDGYGQIYIMNFDGTNQVNISNNGVDDYYPFWSPDGNEIAFASQRDGDWEIYIMKADGTEQTDLSNNDATDYWSTWNPQGAGLTFHSDRDGNYEIYTMDFGGNSITRLTASPAADAYPAWSPSGLFIAFSSARDGNWDIYVMDIDGTNQHNITANASNDYVPQWSPDAAKIAFASDRSGNYEIYKMDVDGTNVQNISNSPSGADLYPSWSPIY